MIDNIILVALGITIPVAAFFLIKGAAWVTTSARDALGRFKAEIKLIRSLPAQVAALAETSTLPAPVVAPVLPIVLPEVAPAAARAF